MWSIVCYNLSTQHRELIEEAEDENQAKARAENHARLDGESDHVYYATDEWPKGRATHRTWHVEERTGYWAVMMYVRDTGGMALRQEGPPLFFPDKYTAVDVATALSMAYVQGGLDALAMEP